MKRFYIKSVLIVFFLVLLSSQSLPRAIDYRDSTAQSSVSQNSVSQNTAPSPDKINYTIADSALVGKPAIKSQPDSSSNLAALISSEKSTAPYKESVPKWYEMVSNIPHDFVRYYDSEITSENIPYFAGITIATIGLIATDEASWKASDKFYKKSPINKSISDFFTDYGDGRSQFALAGLFAAYGFIDNNNRALRTASQIVEAVLASGAVVQVLKHLTGRESPFLSAIPGGTWRFFPNQIEYHKHVAKYDAFPSGHVTTSLAAVIVCAENYPEHKWIKPVGYTFTALLGIGMVNKGIHWYSDYPLAIALGYAFGKLVAHPETESSAKSQDEPKKVSYNLSPYYSDMGTGLTFSVHF